MTPITEELILILYKKSYEDVLEKWSNNESGNAIVEFVRAIEKEHGIS